MGLFDGRASYMHLLRFEGEAMSNTKQEELLDKIKHNILVPFAIYQDPIYRAKLLFEQGAVSGDNYGYGIATERIEKLINSEVTSVLEELEKKAVQYVDGTNTVSVSYIQSVKEKYQ